MLGLTDPPGTGVETCALRWENPDQWPRLSGGRKVLVLPPEQTGFRDIIPAQEGLSFVSVTTAAM